MIKTKSVYYDPIEPEDGQRILVMRRWPRGIGRNKNRIDLWMKEVGPSNELLDDWNNHRIDFAEYERRYLEEMKFQVDKIGKLADLAKEGPITLLCKERTDQECHRRLLKELIEKYLKTSSSNP